MKYSAAVYFAVVLASPLVSGEDDFRHFEVASVRSTAGVHSKVFDHVRGGPGTEDDTFWQCENCALMHLIQLAYNKKNFEVVGPEWMKSDGYTVNAKVITGATSNQLRVMLRALLTERFNLVSHYESRQVAVQLLGVASGKTLKPADRSGPSVFDAPATPAPPTVDSNGYPVIPRGSSTTMVVINDHARFRLPFGTVDQLVDHLSAQLDQPVIDRTGLTGKYDIDLSWDARREPSAPNLGPDLIHAVRDQLGLTLTPRREAFEILVIDHADKTPTVN